MVITNETLKALSVCQTPVTVQSQYWSSPGVLTQIGKSDKYTVCDNPATGKPLEIGYGDVSVIIVSDFSTTLYLRS